MDTNVGQITDHLDNFQLFSQRKPSEKITAEAVLANLEKLETESDGEKTSDEEDQSRTVQRVNLPTPISFSYRRKSKEEIMAERRRNVTLNSIKVRHYAYKHGIPMDGIGRRFLSIQFEIDLDPTGSPTPPSSP